MLPIIPDEVCAFVDVETTGLNVHSDRITEIGLRLVHPDGDEFSMQSLLNPGIAIPPAIQSVTGITQDMVSNKPVFEDIAPTIWECLNDTIFVAHNARFDYAFLKTALKHAGYKFRPRIVCTVKLARELYPEYSSYSLMNICEQIGYQPLVSHRAMADVEAVMSFVAHAVGEHGIEAVAEAAKKQFSKPSLPPHLERAQIDALPDSFGVYRFYGADDKLLYVGKSKHIRQRVNAHFGADIRNNKEMRMAQEVRAIDHTSTAGDLGALLLEHREIQELSPFYNRRQRRRKRSCFFIVQENPAGFLVPQIAETSAHTLSTEQARFGVFSSRRAATTFLENAVAEHRLCKKILQLEKGKGPCFGQQLKKCNGACVGEEPASEHNARLREAFAKHGLSSWPFPEAVVVVEHSARCDRADLHLIDQWIHIGTCSITPEDAEHLGGGDAMQAILERHFNAMLASPTQPAFDKDIYRILRRFFGKRHSPLTDIIPLPARADAATLH